MTVEPGNATFQAWGPHPEQRAIELARASLRAYGDEDVELTLLGISENATFVVDWRDDGRPTTVLRVHRSGYSSPHEIDCELGWVRALRQEAGILTPEVMGIASSFGPGYAL